MPVCDGLEATRRIRAREAAQGGRRAFIAALTACASEDDKADGAAAGMDAYMCVPSLTHNTLPCALHKI